HPSAQKRLLRFLEAQSASRAIWVTSHDNPYVFARRVVSRHTTTKQEGKIVVRPTFSSEDHRKCLQDLGWEPAMAAIADRVIYCEGPSDKLAFEAALSSAEERTIAFQLGGASAVTDAGQREKVLQRIRATAELLPHLEQIVVIDQDDKVEERRKLLSVLA